MNFEMYQLLTEKTAIYPEDEAITYLTLGVAGEAGEIAEKVKKWKREDDPTYIEDIEKEIGDVLWYLARLSDELDLSFEDIAVQNIDKLADRQDRNKIKGEGDNR